MEDATHKVITVRILVPAEKAAAAAEAVSNAPLGEYGSLSIEQRDAAPTEIDPSLLAGQATVGAVAALKNDAEFQEWREKVLKVMGSENVDAFVKEYIALATRFGLQVSPSSNGIFGNGTAELTTFDPKQGKELGRDLYNNTLQIQ